MELDHEQLQTLWHLVNHHAERTPDAIALEFEGRTTTYRQLLQQAWRIREALTERAVGPGDRIAYLGKNNDRYFSLLFGAVGVGAVLVPLNWRLAASEWTFIIEDAGVRLLFSDEEFLASSHRLVTQLNLPAPVDLAGWDELDHPGPLEPVEPPGIVADDIAMQVYTSGTTGRPKGVMLSHRNMLALRAPGYRAGLHWFPTAEDATLVVTPVAHIAGTGYALFGLYCGGRIVIERQFDPGLTLELLRTAGITHMLLVPAAMRQLLEHPDARNLDLSEFKYMAYGASPMPSALLRQSMEALGCGFVQMYGMTETSGSVTALTPEDHEAGDPIRLKSAGRAMPGAEVAILDEEGNFVAVGEIGEISVRSEAVMKGYWNQSGATADTIVKGGWLRTGDLGYIDRDGYVFVMDRTKDMIISGGENVYPAEVENAIFGHPDVVDVAVIGLPSEQWGEEVVAVLVPKPGRTLDPESIKAWTRQHIAAFKVPKSVRTIEELPRNAGGKVLRRELRARFGGSGG